MLEPTFAIYIFNIFINTKTNFDRNLRKAERAYIKRTIDNIESICLNNPKEFWKNLKRFGRRRSHAIPMTIRQNDELNSNPIVVLEEWKNKFKLNISFEGASTSHCNILVINHTISCPSLWHHNYIYVHSHLQVLASILNIQLCSIYIIYFVLPTNTPFNSLYNIT